MDVTLKPSAERVAATALDIEFLPLVLEYKIHRNARSSQVEVVPHPYYYKETTPEPEQEPEMDLEREVTPVTLVFARPLPALKEKNNWWDFVKPVYAFNNPLIRARVEILMSNNIVYITDRKYMIRLQERIREHHLESVKKRIQEREADEIEREKILLLDGKISYDEAPKELKQHPVCRINHMAKRIIDDKKAKIKSKDRTSAYKTTLKRIRQAERAKESQFENELEEDDEVDHPTACVVDADPEEDIIKGHMFSKEDYDNLKFETSLIKLLRETEGVNDMYDLADEILGNNEVPQENPETVE